MSPSDCRRCDRHSRQRDHVARQLGDPDRLAHVEHEHLAAAGHGAGLEDELGRLGDRHEEAGDLGVGDRDRAAAADLLAEALDHRARAESSTLPKRTMPKRVSPARRRAPG
jgi:hypothetical protein